MLLPMGSVGCLVGSNDGYDAVGFFAGCDDGSPVGLNVAGAQKKNENKFDAKNGRRGDIRNTLI